MLLIFRKTALFNIKLQFLMKSLTLIIFWLKNRIYLECDYSEEEGWDFPKEGFPSPPCPAKRSLQIDICPSQFEGDILHKGEAMDTSLPNPPNPVQPNEKKLKMGNFTQKIIISYLSMDDDTFAATHRIWCRHIWIRFYKNERYSNKWNSEFLKFSLLLP